MITIDVLPNELLEHIFLFLPVVWLFLCKFVCSRWRLIVIAVARLALATPRWKPMTIIAIAAAEGYLKFLNWMKRQGCHWVMRTQGNLGDWQALKWPECFYPDGFINKVMACAIYGGQLKVLKWARIRSKGMEVPRPTAPFAGLQRWAATWPSCNGPGGKAIRGTH